MRWRIAESRADGGRFRLRRKSGLAVKSLGTARLRLGVVCRRGVRIVTNRRRREQIVSCPSPSPFDLPFDLVWISRGIASSLSSSGASQPRRTNPPVAFAARPKPNRSLPPSSPTAFSWAHTEGSTLKAVHSPIGNLECAGVETVTLDLVCPGGGRLDGGTAYWRLPGRKEIQSRVC